MSSLSFRTREAVAAASVAGLLMMAYLAHVHFAPLGTASFCEFGTGFSCEVVNKSPFAEILGVPISVMGLGYFALMLGVAAFGWQRRQARQAAFLMTVGSLAFGLYLTGVELFVLGTICVFCELSKLVMILLGAALWRDMRAQQDPLPASWLAAALTGGVLLAVVAWFTRL
jgi:uncharacterized membrane protein